MARLDVDSCTKMLKKSANDSKIIFRPNYQSLTKNGKRDKFTSSSLPNSPRKQKKSHQSDDEDLKLRVTFSDTNLAGSDVTDSDMETLRKIMLRSKRRLKQQEDKEMEEVSKLSENPKIVPQSKKCKKVRPKLKEPNCEENVVLNNERTIFCLLNVTEGRNFTLDKNVPTNLFVSCRFLTSNDSVKSQVSWNTTKPQFHLLHYVPVKIDEDFLARCKDNFLVLEVWNHSRNKDKLVGVAMVPLHQFYLSFKVNLVGLLHQDCCAFNCYFVG